MIDIRKIEIYLINNKNYSRFEKKCQDGYSRTAYVDEFQNIEVVFTGNHQLIREIIFCGHSVYHYEYDYKYENRSIEYILKLLELLEAKSAIAREHWIEINNLRKTGI